VDHFISTLYLAYRL